MECAPKPYQATARYYRFGFSNHRSSSFALQNRKQWENQAATLLRPIQTSNQKLIREPHLGYSFPYPLYLLPHKALSQERLLFEEQNVFVALALQKHLPIVKPHRPYSKRALPHHQNRRDQEYR